MSVFSSILHKGKKHTIFIHVGSGSVSIALADYSEKKPTISHTARESLILKKNITSSRELTTLKNSLDRTIESFITNLGNNKLILDEKIDVVAVFSSPWYVSQTKIVTVEHKEPLLITSDYLESLSKKEAATAQIARRGKESIQTVERETVINSKILEVKLNGYKVQKPVGKRATAIEIALVTTSYPTAVIETLKNSLNRFHRLHDLEYYPFSLIGFSVVRDTFADIENNIFCEIGGEVTDVTISKKGLILETISLPVGSHTLNRQLSETLNILPDVAQSYLSLDSSDSLHQEMTASVKAAQEKVRQTWIAAFKNALTEFSEEIFLPRTIFLISEHGTGDFFLDIMKKTEFREIAFNAIGTDARLLSSRTLSSLVPYQPQVKRDSFLSLTVFFHSRRALSN